MGQKKLQRFAEIKEFPNVFEFDKGMKGKWSGYFKNNNPITLELACGKGEYTLGLARLYPHRNFIGIDIKGNRIWRGAKTALDEGLTNAAFLRIQIDQLTEYFEKNEISEIWITFPDPQLRLSKAKKRLTHPKFLRAYQSIISPGGDIHLKTDSPDLYHFTKAVINFYNLRLLTDMDNIYGQEHINDDLKIKTHYEALDIAGSNRVHYLRFSLPGTIPAEKDKEFKKFMDEQTAF